jgi:Flp pilus assembly pilin Flp
MFIAALRDILRNDEAATMVEYSIMVAFIAAVCIAVVNVFGKNVSNQFSTINSSF